MKITSRAYKDGDYEKYIQSLTKENMQQLFIENFGGWSDELSQNKFFKVCQSGGISMVIIELFFHTFQ